VDRREVGPVELRDPLEHARVLHVAPEPRVVLEVLDLAIAFARESGATAPFATITSRITSIPGGGGASPTSSLRADGQGAISSAPNSRARG